MELFKIVIIFFTGVIAIAAMAGEDSVKGFDYRFAIGDTNETDTFPSFEDHENLSNNIVYNSRGWLRLNDDETEGYYLSNRFSNEDEEPFRLLYAIAEARVSDGELNLSVESSDYRSFNVSTVESFQLVNGSQNLNLQAQNQTYYRFRVNLSE